VGCSLLQALFPVNAWSVCSERLDGFVHRFVSTLFTSQKRLLRDAARLFKGSSAGLQRSDKPRTAKWCLRLSPNSSRSRPPPPPRPCRTNWSSAIVAADFDAGGCNVLESAVVTGKKKKGALQLHPTTILCSVTTKGGEQYKVGRGGKHRCTYCGVSREPGRAGVGLSCRRVCRAPR